MHQIADRLQCCVGAQQLGATFGSEFRTNNWLRFCATGASTCVARSATQVSVRAQHKASAAGEKKKCTGLFRRSGRSRETKKMSHFFSIAMMMSEKNVFRRTLPNKYVCFRACKYIYIYIYMYTHIYHIFLPPAAPTRAVWPLAAPPGLPAGGYNTPAVRVARNTHARSCSSWRRNLFKRRTSLFILLFFFFCIFRKKNYAVFGKDKTKRWWDAISNRQWQRRKLLCILLINVYLSLATQSSQRAVTHTPSTSLNSLSAA